MVTIRWLMQGRLNLIKTSWLSSNNLTSGWMASTTCRPGLISSNITMRRLLTLAKVQKLLRNKMRRLRLLIPIRRPAIVSSQSSWTSTRSNACTYGVTQEVGSPSLVTYSTITCSQAPQKRGTILMNSCSRSTRWNTRSTKC